jgi:50S ribosomal protein L16 3-hydroxylase
MTASPSWRDFDPALFLRDYWQQKPLLIRQAFTRWENPLAPEELAGLACEEEVESRLITQSIKSGEFSVENGPLPESRFGTLAKSHWTLLVQAVDLWVPEVAALIEPFRFIPDWRIDDVMVSYAADQGGVGPHYDQYDVFLIQGLGRRRWRIGQPCDRRTPLVDHPQLRLLPEFEAVEEWLLEPGDILYVPARLAHWGIAEGSDCMTYSIGFRAPSRADLIGYWCDEVLSTLDDDDRYTDGPLDATANPGEIDAAALDRLQRMVLDRLGDRDAFARWFGEWITERKYSDFDVTPERPFQPVQLLEKLKKKPVLTVSAGIRLAFIRRGDAVLLFADGQQRAVPESLHDAIEALCRDRHLQPAESQLRDGGAEWLCALVNEGVLQLADGTSDQR